MPWRASCCTVGARAAPSVLSPDLEAPTNARQHHVRSLASQVGAAPELALPSVGVAGAVEHVGVLLDHGLHPAELFRIDLANPTRTRAVRRSEKTFAESACLSHGCHANRRLASHLEANIQDLLHEYRHLARCITVVLLLLANLVEDVIECQLQRLCRTELSNLRCL